MYLNKNVLTLLILGALVCPAFGQVREVMTGTEQALTGVENAGKQAAGATGKITAGVDAAVREAMSAGKGTTNVGKNIPGAAVSPVAEQAAVPAVGAPDAAAKAAAAGKLPNTVPTGTQVPLQPGRSQAYNLSVPRNAVPVREELSEQQLLDRAWQQDWLVDSIHKQDWTAKYSLGNGKFFYPLEQAIWRAEKEGNMRMLGWLKKIKEDPTFLENSNLKDSFKIDVEIGMYMDETTARMFQGEYWGEEPLDEIAVPARYHSSRSYFNLSMEIHRPRPQAGSLAPQKLATDVMAVEELPTNALRKSAIAKMEEITGKTLSVEEENAAAYTVLARRQDDCLKKIIDGDLAAKYYLGGGYYFNPLEEAIARATEEGKTALVKNLKDENFLRRAEANEEPLDPSEEAAFDEAIAYVRDTAVSMFQGKTSLPREVQEMIPLQYHQKWFNHFFNGENDKAYNILIKIGDDEFMEFIQQMLH